MWVCRHKGEGSARRLGARLARKVQRAAARVEMLEPRRLLSAVQFAPATSIALGASLGKPFAVDVADVNGDGIPDIVVANANGTISILLGVRGGGFASPLTFADGLPAGAGNQQDMAVASKGGRIYVTNPEALGRVSVLNNNGDGIFNLSATPQIAVPGSYVTAVSTTEFLGFSVLVAADDNGEISLTVPNQSGDYSPSYYSVTSAVPNEIAAFPSSAVGGQLPGFPEMFVQDTAGEIQLLSFANPARGGVISNIDSGANPSASIAVADMNSDGIEDLVVGQNSGTIREYLGNMSGGFSAGPTTTGGAADSAYGVGERVGDLDGDGNPDVLFLDYAGAGAGAAAQAQVFLGSSTGALTASGVPFYVSTPLAVADLNGDGKADLIEGYYNSGTDVSGVRVRLNESSTLPTFSSAKSASFAAGFFNAFTISTIGSTTSALSESGALPDGVSFEDNGDGSATLSGTPASTGTYNFSLTANDGVDAPVAQSFTLTVVAPAAPAITSAAAATFTTGQLGTFNVTASGLPFPAITETGALPAGVFFVDNLRGTAFLYGTPAAGTGGTYNLAITAANGEGSAFTQSFVLTVLQPTTFTSANCATFLVGTSGTFTFTTAGFPSGALSNLGSLPAGLTFTNNGDGTATLAGAPALGTGGVYDLTISAGNGVGSVASQSFTLTVDESPTYISASGAALTVGTGGSIQVATRGYPQATITESGALPSGVNFLGAAGSDGAIFSGTPAAAAAGVYAITLSAANGVGGVVTQNLTLMVDSAPAFVGANSVDFAEGQADTFTMAALAVPTATFRESGKVPTGLSFVDNGNGTVMLSGTPPVSAAGTYKINVTATNLIGSATEAITVTIGVAKAPKFTSAAAATFTVGTSGSFQIVATGFSSPALVETGTMPAGLTFTNNGEGAGTISGNPLVGSGGVYTLSLTATNASGKPVTQTLTLTVIQPPTFTTNSADFDVGTAGSASIQGVGYPLPTLSESGALPAGLSFVSTGNGSAAIFGTPAAGTGGAYGVTLIASSGGTVSSLAKKTVTGASSPGATETFDLVVYQAPAFTSAASATLMSGIPEAPISITTSGFPAAMLSESGALPQGVSFRGEGHGAAELVGNPSTSSGGVYVFSLTAQGVIGTVTQTFTLTVDTAVAITSSSTANFAVGQPGTFTVTTSGYPVESLLASPLPKGLAFINNGDGTGTLLGTVSTPGVYHITFGASNIGSGYVQHFTLIVS
jgi:large repetitive protein